MSKVHGTLIAQRQGHQLAPLRLCECDRPLLCRGWPASSPGRLPPGPWSLAGVSVEVSGVQRDFACTFARNPSARAGCPTVTVTLEAGGTDTYTQRAIPGRNINLVSLFPYHGADLLVGAGSWKMVRRRI